MDQIAAFLEEARKFTAEHDDKLKKLKRLPESKDPAGREVLVFTEYADTARYLKEYLQEDGIDGEGTRPLRGGRNDRYLRTRGSDIDGENLRERFHGAPGTRKACPAGNREAAPYRGAASEMVPKADSAVHFTDRKYTRRHKHRLRRTVRGFSMIHFAYLDPGTGTLIVQALLGGTAGLAVLFKTKRSRLARKNKPAEAEQATDQGESDEAAAPIPSAD